MNPPELRWLLVDSVVANPDQPRRLFPKDALEEMAASMAGGQLHPVRVYRRGEVYVLIDGQMRCEAARMAGLETVLAMIVAEPTEPGQRLLDAIVSNEQRKNLGPLELARAAAELKTQTCWSAAQVAERLSISPVKLSKVSALLRLPESVQRLVEEEKVPMSCAYLLAQLDLASEQERLAQLVAQGMTRESLEKRIAKKAKAPGAAREARTPRRVAQLGGGRTISFAGAGLESVQQLVEWLEQLLAKAKKVRGGPVSLETFLRTLEDEARAAEGGGQA